MDGSNALARLDRARRALAEATTVDELKELHDQAQIVESYFRRRAYGREMALDAAEIRVRAERRIGQVLADPSLPPVGSHDRRLPEGVSRDQSARWQKIAGVPDERFEEYIASERADPDGEITTADLLRLADPTILINRLRVPYAGGYINVESSFAVDAILDALERRSRGMQRKLRRPWRPRRSGRGTGAGPPAVEAAWAYVQIARMCLERERAAPDLMARLLAVERELEALARSLPRG